VYSPVIETVVLSFQYGTSPVSTREWLNQVPFQKGSTSVSNRKWFRLKPGVLPFPAGSGSVSKLEYYRFKQEVVPSHNRTGTVSTRMRPEVVRTVSFAPILEHYTFFFRNQPKKESNPFQLI